MANRIVLDLDRRDVLIAEVKAKHTDKFIPYYMICKPWRNGKGMCGLDFIRDFTDSEYWLFKLVTETMDESTFTAVIRGKSLSTTEKRRLLRAYKGLRAKDMVRRVKREYYMLRPNILMAGEGRDILIARYRSLK